LREKLLQGDELTAKRVTPFRGVKGFDFGSELSLSLEKCRLVGVDRSRLHAQRI
jgi:hypothetical protein